MGGMKFKFRIFTADESRVEIVYSRNHLLLYCENQREQVPIRNLFLLSCCLSIAKLNISRKFDPKRVVDCAFLQET